jgi:transposase
MEEKQEHGRLGRVIGMDIHTEIFDVSVFHRNSYTNIHLEPEKMYRKQDLSMLESWMKKHGEPTDVYVFEAGFNSFNTAQRIREAGGNAVVLESQRAGKIRKAYLKTDEEDAKKIGKVYLSGLATEVWIPTTDIKERREIFLAYQKAVKDCTRYRNRIWVWLAERGIKQKQGVQLTKETGRQWILGTKKWTEAQEAIISFMLDDLVTAQRKRKELKRIMALEISRNPQMLKLFRLCGIGTVCAFALVALIGDVTRFQNPKKLVAYFGLQPKVNYSGEKGFTSTLSHYGRKDIRALLVQSAHAILNYAQCDHPLHKWGWKLTFRKNRNIAVIALARKLTVAVWYILRGFVADFEELTQMVEIKLQKLSSAIGSSLRKQEGFKTAKEFIYEKSKIFVLDG